MDRVTDLADPNRCKGAAPDGQCRNLAEYGSQYCRAHGGSTEIAKQEQVNSFLLAKADDRARLTAVSETLDPVKALHDTLSLNLILLEKRWNGCKDDTDLITNCSSINALMLTTERLVTSMNKLQKDLGVLLGQQAIVGLGKAMVQILIEELQHIEGYEHIVDNICHRLFDSIENSNNQNSGTEIEAHVALPAPSPDQPQ
ncbi:MAG: hypothetical protein ACYTFQ_23590 [Planctomycetota bacterium]|jgi:putative hemolysin